MLNRKHQKTLHSDIYKIPLKQISWAHDPTDIISIYWSDKKGIIEYDYKNGQKFKLLNN